MSVPCHRKSERLLPRRAPTPPPTHDPTWDLDIHHHACTEAVCGNKLRLPEEEEMYLFQYNTPILIESEVSDPEKTKPAEMTF